MRLWRIRRGSEGKQALLFEKRSKNFFVSYNKPAMIVIARRRSRRSNPEISPRHGVTIRPPRRYKELVKELQQ
jgi:hypothetical protein